MLADGVVSAVADGSTRNQVARVKSQDSCGVSLLAWPKAWASISGKIDDDLADAISCQCEGRAIFDEKMVDIAVGSAMLHKMLRT